MGPRNIRVGQIGVAGYGETYTEPLLSAAATRAGATLVAAADVSLDRSKRLADLKRAGCRLYDSLDRMLDETELDLVIISTPIHLHEPQARLALDRGIHVLCEKPLAGGLADAARMVKAANRHPHRFLAVGYQWSFSTAVQALKRDVMAGRFGRPLRARTKVTYPRVRSYFTRSPWAGRKLTAEGVSIYDSPVNNATAHFLHHMLYVLGPTVRASADVKTVEAELYRANDIENYDTAAVRCRLRNDAEVLFYTTHAAPDRIGPVCIFEFEHATITYDAATRPEFVAESQDGVIERYGDPEADPLRKLWRCIEAARTNQAVECDALSAFPHALCVAAAQASMPEIEAFPASMLSTISQELAHGREPMTVVSGLQDALNACFDARRLPSELGAFHWAKPGTVVDASALAASASATLRSS